MAKPRELFNTPAPQAMGQMGAGIAEAYANAGRIHGQGMASMGQSIGQGIQAGVSAYTGYLKEAKQMESENKSYEGFLKSKAGQQIFGMSPESVDQFLAEAKGLNAMDQNKYFKLGIPALMQQQLGVTQHKFKLEEIKAAQKQSQPSGIGYNFVQEDSPFDVPRETGGGVVDDGYKDPMPWLPSRSAQPRNPGPYRY